MALLLAALACAVPVRADATGSAPFEITVPAPAGSSADVAARILASGMSKHLGAPVGVRNEPGASGGAAYERVAASKADGHAMVWISGSVSTSYHGGASSVGHRAFAAVARVMVEAPLVAVHAASSWRDLRSFLADAKGNPGKITVGNSGPGSLTHLTSATLFRMAGVEVLDVPYTAFQVVPSLLGHDVDAVVQLPRAVAAEVKAGHLRVLAVAATRRDPTFPEVPTAAEQGVDVAFDAWRGVAVPRGTPAAAVRRLEDAIRSTVAGPDFATRLSEIGAVPAFLPAKAFGELIAADDARYARIMDTFGLLKQ